MTNPDTAIPSDAFALLASGASFSSAVLENLRRQHYLPSLVVLPEYAPVAEAQADILNVIPERQFLQRVQDIEVCYAPENQQRQCAEQLRQRAIDFILVACWPYRINTELLDSPAKAALNLHPSLLPAHRGADPIAAQLAGRETRFGVSLHLLNQEFDAGDIVAQRDFELTDAELDRTHIEQACAALGVGLFIAAVREFDRGWRLIPQKS